MKSFNELIGYSSRQYGNEPCYRLTTDYNKDVLPLLIEAPLDS